MITTATKQVLEALGGDLRTVESPSLRLEKFVHVRESKDEDANKKSEIDEVVKTATDHGFAEPPFRFSEWRGAASYPMRLQARLIVNQAGGILENAGICLHRHFGFPYIPGSAVKGVARHAAWRRWHAEGDPDTERDIALKTALVFGFPTEDKKGRARETDSLDIYLAKTFPDLFGDGSTRTHVAGAVSFLPAWPRGKAQLVTDIVNCHHPKYYQEPVGNPPLDNENPNPQFFPAVDAGTVFDVVIIPTRRAKARFDATALESSRPSVSSAPPSSPPSASSAPPSFRPFRPSVPSVPSVLPSLPSFRPSVPSVLPSLPSLPDLLTFAGECIHDGFEIHGAGAKTAAGYGWFEYDQDQAERDEKERKTRRLEQEREQALAAMSPDDRRVEELGALDREDFIRDYINNLTEKDGNEQRIIIRALLEKHPRIWAEDKTAKPKKKAGKRAAVVREIAASLGIDLP